MGKNSDNKDMEEQYRLDLIKSDLGLKQKMVMLWLCRQFLNWSQPQHYINKENKKMISKRYYNVLYFCVRTIGMGIV